MIGLEGVQSSVMIDKRTSLERVSGPLSDESLTDSKLGSDASESAGDEGKVWIEREISDKEADENGEGELADEEREVLSTVDM